MRRIIKRASFPLIPNNQQTLNRPRGNDLYRGPFVCHMSHAYARVFIGSSTGSTRLLRLLRLW